MVRVDAAALAAHVRAVRSAPRSTPPMVSQSTDLALSAEQVTWFRLAASRVTDRRPINALATAASGGLQDSHPRAAQTALHARLDDVLPDTWASPELTQLWFRWAAFAVPAMDLGTYSRGAMPRDQRFADALHQLSDAVRSVITRHATAADPWVDSKIVLRGLRFSGAAALMRSCCIAGGVVIRWDVRTTSLRIVDGVGADHDPAHDHPADDHARRELVRRYLRWHAPAPGRSFSRWAGVMADDADRTWRSMQDELCAVSHRGEQRWVLAADADVLASATQPSGVRLLPPGEAVSFLDAAQRPSPRVVDLEHGVDSRLVNALTGRLLVDGAIVGAWARSGGRFTIDPWPAFDPSRRDDVLAEVESLGRALGLEPAVRWLAGS